MADLLFLRPDEGWTELLAALFQLSLSQDAVKRETAFRIFATTPGIIEKQHEEAVMEAFNKGFKDDSVAVSFLAPMPQPASVETLSYHPPLG